MAIRTDFTIDWSASPRVITVAAPSTECVMQDLLDTLRYLEAQPTAMEDASIVSASGKEDLGGGTKVGLTVSLQNSVIGFEARPGPDWVTCSLIGGNLVAFDIDKVTTIEPTNPTAFVAIKATSSSSATLQEQDALQYSSYGGAVNIDVNSGHSGTEYPVGNAEYPVDNFPDAVLIANEKGFNKLNLRSNAVLGVGDDIIGFSLVGQNPIRTYVTITDAAITDNCEISECTVAGTLDGNTILRSCVLGSLNYVNGHIYQCGLSEGVIQLGGDVQATFTDCFSIVAGASTPTIDLGVTEQPLAVRGHVGGLRIQNKTNTAPTSIDMHSGHVIIDATVTSPLVILRGIAKVTNEADPSMIDLSGMVTTGTDGATKGDVYAAAYL